MTSTSERPSQNRENRPIIKALAAERRAEDIRTAAAGEAFRKGKEELKWCFLKINLQM